MSNKKARIIWAIVFALFMGAFYILPWFGINIIPITYDGDYMVRED